MAKSAKIDKNTLDTLPRLRKSGNPDDDQVANPPVADARRLLVDSLKDKFVADFRQADVNHMPPTSEQLAEMYAKLRDEQDRLEEELKAIGLSVQALEELTVAQFEAEGIKLHRFPQAGSIGYQKKFYSQLQDRDAFRQYCVDNGMLNLLMLPWGTMNAMAGDLIAAGDKDVKFHDDGQIEVMPGVFAFAKDTLVYRKS